MFSFPTLVFQLLCRKMAILFNVFLTGCGYINYALASVHRMHARGNQCNYVLDLCALRLL